MFVNPDGYPRERIVKKIEYNEGRGKKRVFGKYNRASQKEKSGRQDTASCYTPRKPETKGWTMDEGEFEPGLVCDPFCGSGTTGMAALRLGRSFVGFDLYKENCDIAEKNCQNALVFMRDRNLNPFKRGQ
jgi:DNA modification methylase